MKTLHCPVCASQVTERAGLFSCVKAGRLPTPLGHALRRAIYSVDAPKKPPRHAPESAPYLWCPSCTGELDDQDERGRELRCPDCGLSLPSVIQLELIEFKQVHEDREAIWG